MYLCCVCLLSTKQRFMHVGTGTWKYSHICCIFAHSNHVNLHAKSSPIVSFFAYLTKCATHFVSLEFLTFRHSRGFKVQSISFIDLVTGSLTFCRLVL